MEEQADADASEANKEELEREFWKTLETNNFNFAAQATQGNPMGGRFARRLKSDQHLKADYKNMVGNPAKAAFRREWCKKEFETYKETNSYVKEHSISKQSEGTYFSLNRIAVEEGLPVSPKDTTIGAET